MFELFLVIVYYIGLAFCVRAIWSLSLLSTIAINADGWRRASAAANCLKIVNTGSTNT